MRYSILTMTVMIIFAVVIIISQPGCSPGEAEAASWREIVAVQVASVAMTDSTTPAPSPGGKSKCSNCSGTGRVKTGDGISMTECDECDGSGYRSASYSEPPAVAEPARAAPCDDCEDCGCAPCQCGQKVGIVEVDPDELFSSIVYTMPIKTVAIVDGPPVQAQATDGGYRWVETPGQAVAPAQAVTMEPAPIPDIYPEPVDVLVVAESPAVCGPGGCSDSECATCYSGGAVTIEESTYSSGFCATCGATFSTRRSSSMGHNDHGSHLGHAMHNGDGPVRRMLRGDGPVGKILRGEGRVAKAWRKRRGLFRGFRGCGG